MLRTNVITDGDIRKRAVVERRWRIAGRRREAVGKLPRQDDETFSRVERTIVRQSWPLGAWCRFLMRNRRARISRAVRELLQSNSQPWTYFPPICVAVIDWQARGQP